MSKLQPVITVCALLSIVVFAARTSAQEPAQKPTQSAAEKGSSPKPELPFQVQLLETHIRFESNGDSRKEVHTIVKIINILGAHQFARIAFDYNRSFQQIEIPSIRITHANGGTTEVLPSAVTDNPNPAVEPYPAYHDVRVKAVRILGLQEGDILEYRVITTTTHHPLAPDFWLEHAFDRSGQILEERYELNLPADKAPGRNKLSAVPSHEDGDRMVYRWSYPPSSEKVAVESASDTHAPDIAFSLFSWEFLAVRLAESLLPGSKPLIEAKSHEESTSELARQPEVLKLVEEKAHSLAQNAKTDLDRLKAIYNFVSTQISTVDIPLGATGFKVRHADEILTSGYATAEDKYVLFASLGTALHLQVAPALTGYCGKDAPAIPTKFNHLLVIGHATERAFWLDLAIEVAPFGMTSPASGKCALVLERLFFAMNSTGHEWVDIPQRLPFAASQKVRVDASIAGDGQLKAKVKYTMRGDNELTLRLAFHQNSKDKWKDVANLLAISDGFRGQITSANASDPLATKDPFTVEYELTQPKFVDWSKKPVRIPALLPQISLPDPPAPAAPGQPAQPIALGTPLEVQTSMTLHLPAGTTVETPPATSVSRDYAIFISKYSATQNTVTASRHVNFLKRQLPPDRALDYNAFFRAVQNDQSQHLTLVRSQ